jgi:hypothetical protein
MADIAVNFQLGSYRYNDSDKDQTTRPACCCRSHRLAAAGKQQYRGNAQELNVAN